MSDLDTADELAALSAIVGAPVVVAERAAWGFENRTDIVTLADGRRLVVQRITRRFFAPGRLALARTVPPALRAAGIPAPLLLAGDAHHDPPYAVREFLPGTPANSLLDNTDDAVRLAQAMGALLPRLAAIGPHALPLPAIWADPAILAHEMHRRLHACASMLTGAILAAVADVLAQLPALFAGRPAVFAHGDFCPVNALMLGDQEQQNQGSKTKGQGRSVPNRGPSSLVLGLIDFDEARLADPLFDAAWWGWVVRFHHPERWQAAWPQLLATAEISIDTTNTARVRALQVLRLIEALHNACTHQPATAPLWATRIGETLLWQ